MTYRTPRDEPGRDEEHRWVPARVLYDLRIVRRRLYDSRDSLFAQADVLTWAVERIERIIDEIESAGPPF
jgi:hypothetical protein